MVPIYTNNSQFAQRPEPCSHPDNNSDCYANTFISDCYQYVLFQTLDLADLLHFRGCNLTFKKMAEQELVRRINNGEMIFNDLGIYSVKGITLFFANCKETITKFDLKEFYDVTDSDIKLIYESFPKINSLHLENSCSKLTDTYYFEKMSSLRTLEIIGPKLQLPNLNFLNNCTLETLILHQQYSSCSLDFLKSASSLKKLHLSGIMMLKNINILEQCTLLKDLKIKETYIKDSSLLFKLPLERLLINYGSLGDRSNPIVFKEPKKLKKIEVSKINDLSVFTNCTSLCELKFEAGTDNLDLSLLSELPLKKLVISRGKLNNYTPINNFVSLNHLKISAKGFTDLSLIAGLPLETLDIQVESNCNNFEQLNHLTKLKKLKISSENFIDNTILNNVPLEDLHLSKCQIGPSLLGTLKKLKTLVLEEVELDNLNFLQELPHLESLSIIQANFKYSDLKNFSYCNKLKHLFIDNISENRHKMFIRNLTSIKTLKIGEYLTLKTTNKLSREIVCLNFCVEPGEPNPRLRTLLKEVYERAKRGEDYQAELALKFCDLNDVYYPRQMWEEEEREKINKNY